MQDGNERANLTARNSKQGRRAAEISVQEPVRVDKPGAAGFGLEKAEQESGAWGGPGDSPGIWEELGKQPGGPVGTSNPKGLSGQARKEETDPKGRRQESTPGHLTPLTTPTQPEEPPSPHLHRKSLQ